MIKTFSERFEREFKAHRVLTVSVKGEYFISGVDKENIATLRADNISMKSGELE